MDTSSEDLNDQELADLMADPDVECKEEEKTDDGVGGVEGGIPPEIMDDPSIDSSEEAMSIDDFDDSDSNEPSNEEGNPVDSASSVEAEVIAPDPIVSVPPQSEVTNGSAPHAHDEGDVAQFRKSLSNLSRQLELDRLALMHKTLS